MGDRFTFELEGGMIEKVEARCVRVYYGGAKGLVLEGEKTNFSNWWIIEYDREEEFYHKGAR